MITIAELRFTRLGSLDEAPEQIRTGRYGVIEVRDGKLSQIQFRPFPKLISGFEAGWIGRWRHGRRRGNACWLYFNQPRSCPEYLALTYVESTREASLSSFLECLRVLDQIAVRKGTAAIVCDVQNQRISDRLLLRLGWVAHCPHLRGRHWIKRFERSERRGCRDA